MALLQIFPSISLPSNLTAFKHAKVHEAFRWMPGVPRVIEWNRAMPIPFQLAMAGWKAVWEIWPTNWKDYLTLDLGSYHAEWLRRKGWNGQEDVKSSAGLKVTVNCFKTVCDGGVAALLGSYMVPRVTVGLSCLNQGMCNLEDEVHSVSSRKDSQLISEAHSQE